MANDIEIFISNCNICQKSAPNVKKFSNNEWPPANKAMERWHTDLAGPVWGKTFLIVIDAFSHFPWIFPLSSTTSSAIISKFKFLFSIFGTPICLVSDNGPQYVSWEIEKFFAEKGIKHIRSPPYHPASNGLAERFVRSFKSSVGKLIDEGFDLTNALQLFAFEYRSSPHPSFGNHSPASLFFGREITVPVDRIYPPQISPDIMAPQSGHMEKDKQAGENKVQKGKFEIGEAVWIRNYIGKPNWLSGSTSGSTQSAPHRLARK